MPTETGLPRGGLFQDAPKPIPLGSKTLREKKMDEVRAFIQFLITVVIRSDRGRVCAFLNTRVHSFEHRDLGGWGRPYLFNLN